MEQTKNPRDTQANQAILQPGESESSKRQATAGQRGSAFNEKTDLQNPNRNSPPEEPIPLGKEDTIGNP